MSILKDYIRTLILSLCGGISIGIGGTIFLMCDSRPLGAVLFAVGLTSILLCGLNLYTGMAGYIFDNKPLYLVKLAIVWVGNFGGTIIAGLLMRATRAGAVIDAKANALVAPKLEDGFLSLVILGFFCGILMYVGVDTFKKHFSEKRDFAGIFMPILCVAVFILAGFEHVVADMYYFAAAGKILEGLPATLAVTLGNTLGCVLIPVAKKLAGKLEAAK